MLTRTLLRTKADSSLLSLLSRHPQSKTRSTSQRQPPTQIQTRLKSSSPYGRTHVWKRRLPTLPNPIVPKFPQTVVRSDGTSFIQWTTSPKSLIRLTRDTTNNPVWNLAKWSGGGGVGGFEEESGSVGRLGRFGRKFGGSHVGKSEGESEGEWKVEDGMGGSLDDVSWFEEMAQLAGDDAGAQKGKKKDKKK